MAGIESDGPYGRPDYGKAWSDLGPITGIRLWMGRVMDAVQVRYGNIWGEKRGGNGGILVTLDNGGEPMDIDIIHSEQDWKSFAFVNGVSVNRLTF